MTALAAAAAAIGLGVGVAVHRAAATFPWPGRERSRSPAADPPNRDGGSPAHRGDSVGRGWWWGTVLGTAALLVLVVLRFGASWELPAFLVLAGAGVLLAVIDLRHRLLPDRVVLPATATGAALLAVAAALEHAWPSLLRAGLGALAMFGGFLVLALISPGGLGMGDVKLAALLGLHLGWLGWPVVGYGAVAGFAAQALLALLLLATRRIGRRGELPFGPAMLVGAAVAIGWSGSLLR